MDHVCAVCAGSEKRGIGMRMSPSMSVGDTAERLLGRLSASRAQSVALSDAADDVDQAPKVQ